MNPWLNISLSDTVADCDKSVINSLTTAVKSKIVLDTLPEPYHGNPDAKVYLLNGNPGHSEKDLTFVGCGNAIQAVAGVILASALYAVLSKVPQIKKAAA